MWSNKPTEERRAEITFCYSCGHSEGTHEQNFNLSKGELILGSCLLPIKRKNMVLGFGWIDVCKCKLFVTKEMVREVSLPEQ